MSRYETRSFRRVESEPKLDLYRASMEMNWGEVPSLIPVNNASRRLARYTAPRQNWVEEPSMDPYEGVTETLVSQYKGRR
jgi:hypothetical protein